MDLANKTAYINGDITLSDYLYAQAANIEYYEFPDIDEAKMQQLQLSLAGKSLEVASFESTTQDIDNFYFESKSSGVKQWKQRYSNAYPKFSNLKKDTTVYTRLQPH